MMIAMNGEATMARAFDGGTIDTSVEPTLVIGVGDPYRGDDAIGALLIERLAALDLRNVELATDVHLHAEHVLDILGRRDVVFVRASAEAEPPFEFAPVSPRADDSATTRALSPSAVLDICQHLGAAVPPAHLLAIRGYAFEPACALSAEATQNLDAAVAMLAARIGASVLTSPN